MSSQNSDWQKIPQKANKAPRNDPVNAAQAPSSNEDQDGVRRPNRRMNVRVNPDPNTPNTFHLSIRFPDGTIFPYTFKMDKMGCTSFIDSIDAEYQKGGSGATPISSNSSVNEAPTATFGCGSMSWSGYQLSLDLGNGSSCRLSRLGTNLILTKLGRICNDWHRTGKLRERY